KEQVKKAVKIIALIMIPGILITVFFGDLILLAFGKEYATEGFRFLQILAVSGVFVGVNVIGSAILRIKKKVKLLITIPIINFINITILVYFLLGYGLIGIGVAWIISNLMINLIYFWMFLKGL
ncbi:hypothetical protein KJ671_03180, partial [Patescibacteria group bacterium]|nr:hypothetical protein [Patescibacteria group bacterium]